MLLSPPSSAYAQTNLALVGTAGTARTRRPLGGRPRAGSAGVAILDLGASAVDPHARRRALRWDPRARCALRRVASRLVRTAGCVRPSASPHATVGDAGGVTAGLEVARAGATASGSLRLALAGGAGENLMHHPSGRGSTCLSAGDARWLARGLPASSRADRLLASLTPAVPGGRQGQRWPFTGPCTDSGDRGGAWWPDIALVSLPAGRSSLRRGYRRCPASDRRGGRDGRERTPAGPRRCSRAASAGAGVQPHVADDGVAQRPAGGPVGADDERDAGRDGSDPPAARRRRVHAR